MPGGQPWGGLCCGEALAYIRATAGLSAGQVLEWSCFFGQQWPNMSNKGQTLSNNGQKGSTMVNDFKHGQHIVNTWPNIVKQWPTHGHKNGRTWPQTVEHGQKGSTHCQHKAKHGQSWSRMANTWPQMVEHGQVEQCQNGQICTRFGGGPPSADCA